MSRRLRQTAERLQRRAAAMQGPSVRRSRNKRRMVFAEIVNGQDRIVRRCLQASCRDVHPKCVLRVSEKCREEGVSCRWIHITADEHVCNFCYEHFTRGGSLFPMVNRWRKEWKSGGGKLHPSIKCYVVEEVLPYWLQCSNCAKWRPAQSAPPELDAYRCDSAGSCDEPENPIIKRLLASDWYTSVATPVMLKNSPAMRFIGAEYFCDLVGISPTSDVVNRERLFPMSDELMEIMQPFSTPNGYERALNIDPAVMDKQELENFPEYKSNQGVYLALRNLIVSLWSINPKEWVTPEKCRRWLICRGLIRVWLAREMPGVLRYLTRRGVVNFGLLPPPTDFFLETMAVGSPTSVVVVGAGISGLVAARQLQNLGCSVVVLEAKSEIGGRISDTNEMGIVVGRGGQLITGIVSNPFAIMCHQGDFPYRLLSDACPLLREDGTCVDRVTDKRVECHFNFLLDLVGCYQHSASDDRSLLDSMNDVHRLYLSRSGKTFTEAEEEILHFHISNLEYSCGANLNDVSSLHWSQNEKFAQFAGRHALVTSGCSAVVKRLAEPLDVRLGQRVVTVDYGQPDAVLVATDDGQRYRCSKVLVSVPLVVLQRGTIEFAPPLPQRKRQAIRALGCGRLEKIALRFDAKFWADLVESADYFGHVSSLSSARGLFSIFYDFTPRLRQPSGDVIDSPPYVLMCYLSGEAVDLVKKCTDQRLVSLCMDTLRKLFPQRPIPEPISYIVTRWSEDDDIGMAYSYVKMGASGGDYDAVAASVDNKVFFSGEATNRQFPQTFTGAVMSGLREAYNMTTSH